MSDKNTDYYDHPVFTVNGVRLKTQAMEGIRNTLLQWLWTGSTGGYILGEPRVGKTIAVSELAEPGQLYTRSSTLIPAFYFSIPLRDKKTITSVFRSFCFSCDLAITARTPADHLAEKAVHYLVDLAKVNDSQQLVLIVDEMQRLSPIQFNAFAELYDKAQFFGITLMMIFVGNDLESSSLLTHINDGGYSHIRGRFFKHGVRFRGLCNQRDVKMCLEQYDRKCYPEGGACYTSFFLPEDYKKGWRLAGLASPLWRVFARYRQNYELDSWAMQYFIATVNALLCDLLPHYGIAACDDDLLDEAIRVSGLIPERVKLIS